MNKSTKKFSAVIAGLLLVTTAQSQISKQIYTYNPEITFQNKTCQTSVQTQHDSTVPNTIDFDCYPQSDKKDNRVQCSFKWNSLEGTADLSIQTYSTGRVRHHKQRIQANYGTLKSVANSVIGPNPNINDKASMDKVGAYAKKMMDEYCTDDLSKLKAPTVYTYEDMPFPVDDSKACTFSTQKTNKKVATWSIDCENRTANPTLQCSLNANASDTTKPYLKMDFSKQSYTTIGKTETQTSTALPSGDLVLNFLDFRKAAIKYLKESCLDVLYPKKNETETKTNNSKKAE